MYIDKFKKIVIKIKNRFSLSVLLISSLTCSKVSLKESKLKFGDAIKVILKHEGGYVNDI